MSCKAASDGANARSWGISLIMSSAYGTHHHVQPACAIPTSCQDTVSALHRSAYALRCVRKV
eukprot:1457158-Pyramimonas_sp.AAC.1